MTLQNVSNITDYELFSYKFFTGDNYTISEIDFSNNILVENAYKQDIEAFKDNIRNIKEDWYKKTSNYLTSDEIKSYNYSEKFLDAYGIYKYMNIEDEFQKRAKTIIMNYFINYKEVLVLKDLEEQIFNVLQNKSTKITDPQNDNEILIYIYCNGVQNADIFEWLSNKTDNEQILEAIKKIYIDITNRDFYLNNILSYFISEYSSILSQFVIRNTENIETLTNLFYNAKMNERIKLLPKCSTEFADFYGMFGESTKTYKLINDKTTIRLKEGLYRYNYIFNKIDSENCQYDGMIYLLEGDYVLPFPGIETNLSVDDVFLLKRFNEFLNYELFETIKEFQVINSLINTLKNSNDTDKESLFIVLNMISDLLNLIDAIQNDRSIEANMLASMMQELKVIIDRINSLITPENVLSLEKSSNKLKELYNIFYNDIQLLLATNQNTDVVAYLLEQGQANNLLTDEDAQDIQNAQKATGNDVQALFNLLADKFKEIMEFIVGVLGIDDLKDFLKGIMSGAVNFGSSLLKSIGSSLKDALCLMMKMLGKIIGFLEGILGKLADFFSAILGMLGDLMNFISDLLKGLACLVSEVLGGVLIALSVIEGLKKAMDFVNGVVDFFEGFPTDSSTIKNIITDIAEAIVPDATIEAIKNLLNSNMAPEDLLNAILNEVIKLLGEIGLDAVESMLRKAGLMEIIEGLFITNAIADLAAAIKAGALPNIIDTIQNELGGDITPEVIQGACSCADDVANNLPLAEEIIKALAEEIGANSCNSKLHIKKPQLGSIITADLDSNLKIC